ncbi:MAG TPA: GNAT family N-acetyltransferase [Actinomycetota bacterium]|jgi:ribosomal protein S18 acetylase RimI-like enzyme|nr:GNAT family N-acetyltransferase [Actinomycetota bacterium]
MSLSVRRAELAEASLVRDVMLLAYREYQGALPIDSGAHGETIEDVIADMQRGGAILAEDGVPVGSARFVPEDGYLYVGRLSVLPAHRRRGIASAIMRFAEQIAADLGRPAVQVGVRESLPSNARLYESLGYETVSIEAHPRGPDRVLTMVKSTNR